MVDKDLKFDEKHYLDIINQKDQEIENLKNRLKELEAKDLDNQTILELDIREVGYQDPILGYNMYRNHKEKNPKLADAAKEGAKDRNLGALYMMIFIGVIFLISVISTNIK